MSLLPAHAAPNAAQIQHGVEWTIRELDEGRSCYIHCAHGHGRSATVLGAVLMALGKARTAEEAVAVMR
jgi:protein-tyrosine phosphatase